MEREKTKINGKKIKENFNLAIKDKKRWIMCSIEILIAGLLILADMLTKKYIYGYCEENGALKFIPYVISFTSTQNTGASFGIFAGHTTALTVVSIICAVFLFFFIFYSYRYKHNLLRASLVMILAGALGNIIDRLAFGYVRDFIKFDFWPQFAIFNFADMCLTIGAVLLIIYVLFFYSKDEKRVKEENKGQEETIYAVKSTAKPLFVRKNNENKQETQFKIADSNNEININNDIASANKENSDNNTNDNNDSGVNSDKE